MIDDIINIKVKYLAPSIFLFLINSFIIGIAKNTPITIQKYQFTPRLKNMFI